MARIRTIKPELFLHEGLASLSPIHRYLFIGLFTQADREGRMEYRPKRIKVCILPYDDVDMEKLLKELTESGFLINYNVNGTNYLAITNFLKHQYPNVKEPESTIPAPPKHHAGIMQVPSQNAGKGKEGNGKERNGKVSITPPTPPQELDRVFANEEFRKVLTEAYPNVDIGQQHKSMRAWMVANPTKARKKNYRRFVQLWLSKEARSHESSGASRRPVAKDPRPDRGAQLDALTKTVDVPKV